MRKNFKYIFVLALLLSAILIWREVSSAQGGTLKFYLLDVGQGDALFIETPSGNQVLIDGGPDRSVLRELGQVMPFYDHALDLVILTHPHLDHVAGLVEVFKRYEVTRYLDAGDERSLAEYGELKKLVQEKGATYRQARRGLTILLDKNIMLEVLYPEKVVASSNPHRNVVISRLSFGANHFLLMGDGEVPEEFYLVGHNDALASQVLKVGHHGSKTSSSQLFLEQVRPQFALISVGRKNKYGHPTQEVLENLAAVGAKILRTDLNGRIEITSDGLHLFLNSGNI
ncbi:MAG: ComEC/Rec2 family competence protein [bacterium]|nr:ComEC/Rec2 family competence protein [bacterium]